MTAQLQNPITVKFSNARFGDAYLNTYRNFATRLEMVHMAMMDKYVIGYSGGTYQNLETSTGGVARVLEGTKAYRVVNPDNYFDCEMSGRYASLAMFIMALNHLAWKCHAEGKTKAMELLVTQQEILKDWLYTNTEGGASVLRFLD